MVCQSRKKLREYALKFIQDTKHIYLIQGNISKKLRKIFSNGSLLSLFVLGKFDQIAMEPRENSQN